MRMMRLSATALALALVLTGCAHTPHDDDARSKTDADDAAYKAGKVAHVAAEKTEKAAKVAGQKIKEAAHSAEQGWKDSKPK